MTENKGSCGYSGQHIKMGETGHKIAKGVPIKAHGFGHPVTQRQGAIRTTGAPNAHRIGAGRKK